MRAPTEYKLYLLSEFKKRHQDLTQKQWLEEEFMKFCQDCLISYKNKKWIKISN